MLYLGLDVHSKWMTVVGFDPETGETIEIKQVRNDPASLEAVFSGLAAPLYGAMEVGTNSWAVYRTLEAYFERLVVVDPATVWGREVKRGAKTDRKDAEKLAIKMYRGELEALYVPDPVTQQMRDLTRAKINMTRHVTKTVNEIGSLLRSWGIILECSLLSKEGERVIQEAKERLPEQSRVVLDMYLAVLRAARNSEAELERAVEREAAKDETCRTLMSIPGVGALTSLVVRAEVGDIRRFGSAEQFISYCGLSPTVHQSSETTRYGRLNRACNRFLKYVILLRANGVARTKADNPLRSTYLRLLLAGKKRNNVKLTVARQLTRVMFCMMREGACWDPTRIRTRRASTVQSA